MSPGPGANRPALHPLTWWVWAGGIAVALTRLTSPVVIGVLIAAVVGVALICRPAGGRGASLFTRTLEASLVLGAIIVVVRTGFYILVGFPDSSPVLFHLPVFDLPWFTNLHILGPIHSHGLIHAVTEGLRLAGLVVTFGAAAAISNPRRALRHLPSSLHHIGTAAVIAVAAAPELIASARRIRRAQRLRLDSPKRSGLRGWATVFTPVLAGALEGSLVLAASMDSRGYARAMRSSRAVGIALVVALIAGGIGTYALLDQTTPAALAVSLLAGGLILAIGASIAASKGVHRTRYWATTWGWRGMLITGAGLGAGALGATGLSAGAIGAVLLPLLTHRRAPARARRTPLVRTAPAPAPLPPAVERETAPKELA